MTRERFLALLLIPFLVIIVFAFLPVQEEGHSVFMRDTKRSWADSVFISLSPEERIAQLFMVAAYSNKDAKHEAEIEKLIREQKIGGLIFFQGGPARQASLTNRFQRKSKVPLMISIDGEWGLAMRLDSTVSYPRQMTLGAIADDSVIYKMGKEIARQCRRLGIHVNLAPVADVNNNPNNPVIGTRSFGEDKFNVARKAVMYMKGLQDGGVLANGKHFPGHGDTDKDSHKTLPVILHSRERLDSLELYPFRELIRNGLGSMMVAHLYIPSLDSSANTASTLSPRIVNELLKKELKFDGLIFTDALNMKGVSKFFQPGEVDVKALLAGNDVLLFAENVPLAISEIKKAITENRITQEEIDKRCIKILRAKEWCGLDQYKPVDTKNLIEDLNNAGAEYIRRLCYEKAVTVLANGTGIIPINGTNQKKIATIALGSKEITAFQEMVSLYAKCDHYNIPKNYKSEHLDTLNKYLATYDVLLISIHNLSLKPDSDFGFQPRLQLLMNRLIRSRPSVLTFFSNPYLLGSLDSVHLASAVVMGYEENLHSQEVAAMAIFGGIGANGMLPVTSSPLFKAGNGKNTGEPVRLSLSHPGEFMQYDLGFRIIDSLVKEGISEKAFPGAQLLVMKNGKVIRYSTYGAHTYTGKRAVKRTDLYDLASVTKIVSSTAALMKLCGEGVISVDQTLGFYLPELDSTNKRNLVIRQVLAHQAGLKDWIPFWTRTVKKGVYKPGIYQKDASEKYPFRVAEKLYINATYKDTIWKRIVESDIRDSGELKYSDLGYYFLQRIIEQKTGKSLDQYVQESFYDPMGLPTMMYRPRNKYSLRQIPPTEYDARFRKQLIWGDVHDQGAAMMGGVAGHAGLFSNAFDLAAMMQLFMNKGYFGGKKYMDPRVVEEFTACSFCPNNRRGIGFDKPEPDSTKAGPVPQCVSLKSYGHSGFTGTFAWADPGSGIVVILLTNRVFPDAEKNKLVKIGTRSKVLEEVCRMLK
ncbi:MAG: serine hydrolase [Bacteroidia bacterium]|nr:serine hydrolase [Bacteroidia bacterium]